MPMNQLIVTIDLDWACEPAIEETLEFFKTLKIIPTVFITHRSPSVEACMNEIEGKRVINPIFSE
jgi:hypothetical protein